MARKAVLILIAFMLSLPFFRYLETESEASVPQAGFHPGLLLTVPQATPDFSRLRGLDQTVILSHTVGPREDLWAIAQRYHIDQFTIRSSNDLDLQAVQAGNVLRIPNHPGTVYEVKSPETLDAIRNSFQKGRVMGDAYKQAILCASCFPLPDLNGKDHPYAPGTILFLPDAWKPSGLYLPFLDMHFRKTSGFGQRRHPVLGIVRAHKGQDLAKPYGSPVHPARSGVVVFAGWQGGYGNMVEIRHAFKGKNGTRVLYTIYGHLSKIYVRPGQYVGMYHMIGRVGSTGISTGPHLHFEVRDESGNASNPSRFSNF